MRGRLTRAALYRLTVLVVILAGAIGITGAAVVVNPYNLLVDTLDVEEPPITVEGGDPAVGRQALQEYGCIACHTIPGVRGPEVYVGPPLTAWSQRVYIAGRLPNQPDNLIAWIENPQAIDPGNAMPVLGVSEQEARDMAAYLYTIE